MKYLIDKAFETLEGLENVKAMRFYPSTHCIELNGYTNDVLIFDFDNEVKVFRYNIVRQQFELIECR